jgi:hypothetical protein
MYYASMIAVMVCLPTIAFVCFWDIVISGAIVAASGRDMNSLPPTFVALAYAFIAGGWVIGAIIGDVVLALRWRSKRARAA